MNRTAAEKAAREIAERNRVHSKYGCSASGSEMADIIERACGQDGLKELGEAIRTFFKDESGQTFTNQMKILKALKKAERSCGETAWVSVEERLPEVGQDVLALWASGGINVDRLADPRGMEYPRDAFESADDNETHATHWQPLPSPPTGRTNAEEEGR